MNPSAKPIIYTLIISAVRSKSSVLFLFLVLIACSKKNDRITTEKIHPVLLKIGYYPSFHQPAETIVNFNEKYLIFYKPKESIVEPPPPPMENGKENKEQSNYKKYLAERPELVAFKVSLNEEDLNSILYVISTFKAEDFIDDQDSTAIDGMSINMVILFSDGKLIQMNPFNSPNEKQKALYKKMLSILMEKNMDKNNSLILQKIENYN